jgi:hypothetical protein
VLGMLACCSSCCTCQTWSCFPAGAWQVRDHHDEVAPCAADLALLLQVRALLQAPFCPRFVCITAGSQQKQMVCTKQVVTLIPHPQQWHQDEAGAAAEQQGQGPEPGPAAAARPQR